MRSLAIAVLALVLCSGAAAAPIQLVEAGGDQFPFRSYVLTLPKAQTLPVSRVHVTEQGRPVHALSVLPAQTAKQGQFGVVLAIDASESMRGAPIADAMAAARAFAAHRNPNQQLAVVIFNSAVHIVQPLTTSSGAIDAALSRTPKLLYGTHIYDALQQSARLLSDGNVQGASIVLLSDGADVGSVAKASDVLDTLSGGHVRAFTVGLASSAFDSTSLEQAASATHGSYTRAAKPSDLTPIFDALGYRLSREYLVSYQSLAGPGAHIHVRAKVDGIPGAASSGYVTPKLALASAKPYHASFVSRIIESSVTMVLIAFLAAAVFGWAISRVVRPSSGTVVQRVGGFVTVRREPEKQAADLPIERRVDLLRGAEGAFEKLRWWPRFKATLELADVNASPTQVVLLTLLGTAVVMLMLYLVLGGWGIVLSLATPFVAREVVEAKLRRKRHAFEDQLPDNLEVLAAALRAGHSLVGALSAVVETSPEPSTSELRRVVAEEQLGVPLEDALKAVVERMDNRDLDQVALVARLQRETGANAAEVIDRVIETVRSRADLRRLVRTLTTQGRLSRWILTGLPLGLALALPVVSPGYLDPLFHRGLGQALLVLSAVMVAAGSYVIGRLVDIKV
jgi:tight adherence protein B